jgi:hypothetical protein
LNLLATLGFVVFLYIGSEFASLGTCMRYTELDRAEVINQPKLAQSFPSLVPNDRHLAGQWLAEPVLNWYHTLGVAAAILAITNLMGAACHFDKRTNSVPQKPESENAD